jgi:hypothetical protein
MSSIFKIIENYERDFIDNKVQIVDGYDFNQLATVKDNQRYYAGKFRDGNEDEFGYKYFANMGKPRVKNSAKNTDIDTKDINIRATSPDNDYKSWIMRRDVKLWMKRRNLGVIFNEMAILTPKYGTFVLKKVGGKEIVRKVDLKNLKNDQTCEKLAYSGWAIEDHYYTPSELQAEVELRGWASEQVEKAIASFRTNRKENYDDNTDSSQPQGDAQYIHVKEFYGDVPETCFDEKGDSNKYKCCNFIIVSPEPGKAETTEKEAEKQGLILYKKEIKSIADIYKEVHFDREEGRWLGVGIIEDLRDTQIMKNEQINQMMLAIKLANLILFQTGDETIARNILTDLVNGDIVKVKQELKRIDTENHGLNTDTLLSREIQTIADSLSNSFEVTTGESLPSGTPFSLGMLIDKNANKLFDFILENMGMFIQDVFENWVIPELEKDLSKAHLLGITNKEEMQWIMGRMKNQKVWSAVSALILETGTMPTQAEVQLADQVLTERMMDKESLALDLPDDFYDFEKAVEVDVTDERHNKGEQLTTLGSIMQVLGKNPEMIDSPVFHQILDMAGFADIDFRGKPNEMAPQQQQQTSQKMAQMQAMAQ